MGRTLARQLIDAHLVAGTTEPSAEIGLRMEQTLTQDATGTLVMLELEAMGVAQVATEVSVQYVDHNLLQTDYRNPDDHVFLRSACRRFGVWWSRPGNGVSHVVHMERFGIPGQTLAGSDSHTPAAGALGMLAFGAGGMDVAAAMAGHPLWLAMPRVHGVELIGALPPWVSAKDVVLELLRRHGVTGMRGFIVEYFGDGLAGLSAMDRHVIANMGTEMGASTSVFPSDERTREFLRRQNRAQSWRALAAEPGASYDRAERIDLRTLEPLIACPSSPGNVRTVREVAGKPIYQAYIGSSANPGLRDLAVPALMLAGRHAHDGVSLDINPASRAQLETFARMGLLADLIAAGARLHQAGCNGCIGMGQAPATGRISLRTVPRNFAGRSGTREDQVYLVSPETAAASALTGVITDPRDLATSHGLRWPDFAEPEEAAINQDLVAPSGPGASVELERGPNIRPLPTFAPLAESYEVPVALVLGNDVSTDDILPAGQRTLPFRSNVAALAAFAYAGLDETFAERARAIQARHGGHVLVAGENYAQGSSREHAALVPRLLGQVAVIARSYARIGWQNLANAGILPLTFADPADYDRIGRDHLLAFSDLSAQLASGVVMAEDRSTGARIRCAHQLSARQIATVIAGGLINLLHHAAAAGTAPDPPAPDNDHHRRDPHPGARRRPGVPRNADARSGAGPSRSDPSQPPPSGNVTS
jgi:aconitate hydratase